MYPKCIQNVSKIDFCSRNLNWNQNLYYYNQITRWYKSKALEFFVHETKCLFLCIVQGRKAGMCAWHDDDGSLDKCFFIVPVQKAKLHSSLRKQKSVLDEVAAEH